MGCTSFFFKTLLSGSSSTLKSGCVSFFLLMMLLTFFAEIPFLLGVTSGLIPFSATCKALLLFSWYVK